MDHRNLTLLTDLYELTMMQGYFKEKDANETVIFDMFYRTNPHGNGFAICAGLEQAIEYIKGLHFDESDIEYLRSLNIFAEDFLEYLSTFRFTGDIYAIPEGTVVFPRESLIKVIAPIMQAQLVETALLTIINHQSLIATKTERIVHAAKGDGVMEFGLRRAQGADAGTYGARAAMIAGCIGTIYGAIAGYVGGAVDNVMMRLSEMILSFPSLILAMIINAVMGSNLFNTMFALVIVAWPSYARVMRSVVLSVRENEYVTASEALGASRIRILLKEIIPNSITSVLIMATTDIGNQILMFSTLSFLGLGSAPPTPEWGMMVSDGVQYFNKFWVAGFPGLAIFTMAVGANFIGDGLRDLLDPKLRKEF